MGAHNLKYFCLVKLFAGLEIISHLILDQLIFTFLAKKTVSINQFLLDYFQLQLHTHTSRQCCCIAGKMNFSEEKNLSFH